MKILNLMSDSALFNQVITRLRTTSDVSQVLLCLEEFIDTVYSRKDLQEQQLIFRKLPLELANVFITSFANQPITAENQIAIKRKIDALTDQLHLLKNLQLTIAFQPNEETITYFSEWVKKNINKDLLIDLRFDKSIVGGAVIIVKGTYKDYSVRKNLSNRFQIQRDDILGLLE